VRVSVASTSAGRDQDAFPGLGEVVKELAGFKIVNNSSQRNGDFEVLAVLSMSIATLAVLAAARAKDVVITKLQKRVVLIARYHVDAAAVSSVTAARTASRDELFPPKGDASVPTVAGMHGYFCFVDEHGRL